MPGDANAEKIGEATRKSMTDVSAEGLTRSKPPQPVRIVEPRFHPRELLVTRVVGLQDIFVQ